MGVFPPPRDEPKTEVGMKTSFPTAWFRERCESFPPTLRDSYPTNPQRARAWLQEFEEVHSFLGQGCMSRLSFPFGETPQKSM